MNYTEWTLQEKDVIFRGCLLTSPGHQFLTVPRHCVRHSVSVPHRAISKVRKHSFSAHIDFLFVYFILRLRRLYDHAATAHHAPTAAHGTGAAKLDGFFRLFSEKSGIIWSAPSTYWRALISPFTLQYVFNILLLMPLGMYLRYYFKRNFLSTAILVFCTSLFFEISQLTALFGIYPRPYRCFDIDDLICNTLGGILGFLLIGPMTRFLPSLDKMAASARKKGVHISVIRRGLAYLIDRGILALLNVILALILRGHLPLGTYLHQVPLLYAAAHSIEDFVYFAGFTILLRGYTPGKLVMRFKVVSSTPNTSYLHFSLRVLLRYFLLYGYFYLILNSFDLASAVLSTDSQRMLSIYEYASNALLGLTIVALVGESIFNWSEKGRDYLWGILSKTRVQATNRYFKRTHSKSETPPHTPS